MKKISNIVLVLVILLFTGLTFADNGSQNGAFLGNMIGIVPQPADSEFSSYQTLVETFFEAVNTNNPDIALKCFPIVEDYRARGIDTYFERLGFYSIKGEAPIPTDDLHNFLVIFANYNVEWEKFYMKGLLYSNPELMDLQIKITDKNWRQQLNKVKAFKMTTKYSKPEITKEIDKKLNVIHQAMKVEQAKILDVTVSLGKEKLPELMIEVVKIKSNWRILNIMDL